VSSIFPSLNTIPALSGANAMITFSDGTLSTAITNYFWLNNNTVNIFAGQTNGLALSLSKANGQWTGSFKDPATGARMTIRGILLKDQNQARGYFLGAQTGYMLIEPN
jgi:hypothetical protein